MLFDDVTNPIAKGFVWLFNRNWKFNKEQLCTHKISSVKLNMLTVNHSWYYSMKTAYILKTTKVCDFILFCLSRSLSLCLSSFSYENLSYLTPFRTMRSRIPFVLTFFIGKNKFISATTINKQTLIQLVSEKNIYFRGKTLRKYETFLSSFHSYMCTESIIIYLHIKQMDSTVKWEKKK